MKPTHMYIGPQMRRGKISRGNDPLKPGDHGTVHGKRGGLRSFQREDGQAFWVPPQHLEKINA